MLDENDNAPIVVQPLQKVISVRENEPVGTVVAQIVATDPDLDENAAIVYDFNKGSSLGDGGGGYDDCCGNLSHYG